MRFPLCGRKSGHRSRHSSGARRLVFEPLERRYAMDGGLALTEIMYNPADPQSGTFVAEDFEFIEIKNISAQPIQLGGIQLVEDTTPGSAYGISYTFAQQSLAPGAYVVVARNLAAFQSKYGTGIDVVGPFGGALGNGGERLVMRDAQAATIFDFEYDDGWKPSTDGDGKSLVLLNPLTLESQYGEAGSWDASNSLNGSPGRDESGVIINEVLSHTDEALGDWIEVHNTTLAPIGIGGWFLSDDESEPSKFRIPNGTIVPAGGYVTFTQDAQFDNAAHPGALIPFGLSELGEEVVLSQANAAGTLGAYQVVTSFGAFDREVTFGRHVMSTGESAFPALATSTFGAANDAPRVDALVINELMFQPAQGGDEFIELRNLFQIPVSLFDPANPANVWKLDGGVTFDFPASTTLAANGYALVTQLDPAQFRTKYAIPMNVPIFGPYAGSLSNSGEEISLMRPGDPETDGTVPYYVVDRVDYLPSIPWPTGAAGTGNTLARNNPLGYGEDPINWTIGEGGGTPGAATPTTPAAPTNVTATVMAANQIRLTWTDGVANETGFRIERSLDGVAFVEAGTTAANATSFDDTKLQSSRQYTYRVRAFNANGNGAASNVANATTPALTDIVGGDGADTFHVIRSGSQLQVYVNESPAGQPTYSSELAALPAILTISGLGGNDMLVTNANGQPTLGVGQLSFHAGQGTNTLMVASGGARVDSTANGGTLNTTVQSGAHLSTGRLVQNGLSLADGSKVTLLPDGSTSSITSLTLGTGATLDITNNALVLDYSGVSPAAATRDRILSGRGGAGFGASWTGAGITSSTAADANAAEPESRSVGYAENASLPLGAYTNFRGLAVDATAVLIAYTRTADANLDGVVNDDDVTVVGATYAPGVSNPHWALGDFEYNGFVDDDDVTLLGVLYDPAAAPLAATPLAPVVAGSPDPATETRAAIDTFGQASVRGQETRAPYDDSHDAPADRDALFDLLADAVIADAANRGASLSDGRLPARQRATDSRPAWIAAFR